MVDDFGCTDCHKFHDKGQLGDAPDLTGYGSPEWIARHHPQPGRQAFLRQAQRPHARLRGLADRSGPKHPQPAQIEMLTELAPRRVV